MPRWQDSPSAPPSIAQARDLGDTDLPTIGDSKRLGMVRVHVTCANLHCRKVADVAITDLGMPDDLPFIHIERSRRFRCLRCGNRRVEVSPDWTTVKAYGTGNA